MVDSHDQRDWKYKEAEGCRKDQEKEGKGPIIVLKKGEEHHTYVLTRHLRMFLMKQEALPHIYTIVHVFIAIPSKFFGRQEDLGKG